MVIAAVTGLRCTLRGSTLQGRSRNVWLLLGAVALACGIWTLHFVAMLGFDVNGTPVRYDVALTLISFVVAVAVVGAGVLAVGRGAGGLRSLLVSGALTGLGVAGMHYTGMVAVRIDGSFGYDPALVAGSLAIAVTAATVALWLAFNIRGLAGAFGSALVMGIAVSAMHYTGMAAISADVADTGEEVTGATGMEFIVPLTVGVGVVLLIVFSIIAVSPIDYLREEADREQQSAATARHRRTPASEPATVPEPAPVSKPAPVPESAPTLEPDPGLEPVAAPAVPAEAGAGTPLPTRDAGRNWPA